VNARPGSSRTSQAPGELDAVVRDVEQRLRLGGDIAAADRLRAVNDRAFTTGSEWLGELRLAVADARRLAATSGSRSALRALALRLPGGSGSARWLPVAVHNLALLVAVFALLGSFTTYVPAIERRALWQVLGIGALAIAGELAVWMRLPTAGRAVACVVLAIAGFAVWMAVGRLQALA
jgi:hypothetical protein